MTRKRMLPKIQESQQALGLPTIMDRALAAAFGIDYVHLAVFSIDIDRVYWEDPERSDLPFGWEVFLTEHYMLTHLDVTSDDEDRDLIESACASIMEETPGEPPLGGQLVFAVYDALKRGALPEKLAGLFSTWHKPPEDLTESLAALWKNRDANLVMLAQRALDEELEPALAPPTQKTLRAWAGGNVEW